MAKEIIHGDYRKSLDKRFLGHWDCPPNGDGDYVITITEVYKDDVNDGKGGSDRKHIIENEEGKPLLCNKTNLKMIAKVLGTPDTDEWRGKRVALYDARVPQAEDGRGIRVRDYPPKETEVICEKCGKPIKPIDGYSVNKIVLLNKNRYGMALCVDCAKKMKEAE